MSTVITNFYPVNAPVGSIIIISGSGFDGTTTTNNTVTIGGGAAVVTSCSATQLNVQVMPACVTGSIAVTVSASTATTPTNFTVLPTLSVDTYSGTEDSAALTPSGLLPYLRAMLKDAETDITQLGVTSPTWSDAALLRYLELARGEYSRHRPQRGTVLMQTAANQQVYTAPVDGSDAVLGIQEVFWDPAGYDLELLSALDGGGLIWGGGAPLYGRIYFDSPASIQVWAIQREAFRNAFGGKWRPGENPADFYLLPCPVISGLNVLVYFRIQRHWSAIPWEHRGFILAQACLSAIEALTYQIVASAPAQNQKLNLGLRALTDLIEQKTANALNIRAPGVTAGRS